MLSVLSVEEAADLGIALDTNGNTTIIDILRSTNALANSGLLYDKNNSGEIDTSLETLPRKLANKLYSAINEQSNI